MYQRFLTSVVAEALADTPVVFLTGARQTGKSTLVQAILAAQDASAPLRRSLTFDDLTTLGAARRDPQGFIDGLTGPVAIDEIQRVPEVLLPIKAAVDRDRRPGRFLLTGSANVLLLPRVADTLAGRMEVVTLRPLSQGELRGTAEGFLSRLWAPGDSGWQSLAMARADVLHRVFSGGYPEVLTRPSAKRRDAWFAAYLTTILSRDMRDLTGIDAMTELPRVLRAMAARTANLVSYAEVARDLAVPVTTLRRHMGLLHATYLLHELPAWSVNIPKRLVKAPKALMTDTGLAAHLLGVAPPSDLGTAGRTTGALVETFVGNELLKQIGWHDHPLALHHFRTHAGAEVDYVLEAPDGRITGIEVKLASTLRASDVRGLVALQEAAGPRFVRGIVLYTGTEVVPLGQGLTAVPMANLWG